MPQFQVIERQTILVAYIVEADDCAAARCLVQHMGVNDHDVVVKWESTKIVGAAEIEPEEPIATIVNGQQRRAAAK